MLMQIHTECNLTFRGLRTCIVTHLTELKVKQAKSFLLVQRNQEKLENDNTEQDCWKTFSGNKEKITQKQMLH